MSNQRIQHDYYKILGIGKTASQDDIKRAYRTLIGIYHPDRHQQNMQDSHIFLINEAYETLKDPNRRANYDRLHTLYFGISGATSPIWEMVGGSVGKFFRQAQKQLKQGIDNNARIVIASWEQLKGQFDNKSTLPTLTITLAVALSGGQVQFVWQGTNIKTTLPQGLYQGAMVKLIINRQPVWFVINIQSSDDTYVNKRDIHHTLTLYPWQVALGETLNLSFSKNLQITLPPLVDTKRAFKIADAGIPSINDEPNGDLYLHLKLTLPAVTTLSPQQKQAFIDLQNSFKK